MKRILMLLMVMSAVSVAVPAQDDYYLKKAQGYQREAAYYTRKGDLDRARSYSRYAENAMDDYKTQLRYAENADEKAATYLRWAAEALEKV